MEPENAWKSIPLTEHPATLPKVNIPDSTDCTEVAKSTLQQLYKPNIRSLADNAIWRDSFAFSGTFRTFFGPDKILQTWQDLTKQSMPNEFQIDDGSPFIMRLGPEMSWIQATFSFHIHGARPSRCSGTIGISPANASTNSDWRIWLLCTVLEQPEGFPDVDRLETAPKEVPNSNVSDSAICQYAMNGSHSITAEDSKSLSLDCLVVGAGIGGLCMAARLKALGLSYIVVEKHEEIGDVWTKDRYDSVRLHTSKHYNQMPGTPPTFGKDDPYLLTGQQLSDGFKRFAEMFGVNTNVMTSTCLEKAEYNERERVWSAQLKRQGQALRIRSKHIVLAIGDMGHKPNVPMYEDHDTYKGDIIHARAWKNATPWKGKRGVVIGSANSAHDVISDMDKSDFESITLIQRSRAFVLPGSTFSALVDPVYNENTLTDVSDRILLSLPLSIQRLEAMAGIRAMADLNPTKFDQMEANGFKTRRYGDLWGQIYESQGKHFFDIGAGDLIANGRVKVRSDALPVAYTESGLLLDDGTRIDADVVVFATGYTSNFRSTTHEIFGPEVSRHLRPFWGLDAEGEVLGAWRQTGHHGIWYTGHGFAHARYYSRFVAIQIKADILGQPFEAYETQ
ncbi:hypothetical protein M409DRAFT_20155 [Zasmidium cellare ATCC 36951]|uniref:FAD/NAD(P)-binding domain-containing protein n=1 Tax=Zasmidium cellare ATCC 36951 TaxID=1080233 RepID=A0A6A6CU99_ZASCE|nr:uncharacterized protein M409DRAFT_20155 [Zasmidium cellare ATCC 36951]KAF2169740.1 hypothetical protein M409DRAFT_20155 [Zasmidium cellare ATCC 36951]